MMDEGPLLLSVPHSGRHYPPELVDGTRLPLDQLRLLEDPLVDILVADAAIEGTAVIAGSYARAWIDLNRRETELDPRQISPPPPSHVDHRSPRVAAGLGLIPQTAGGGRALYDQPIALEAVSRRVREVHRPYHGRIAERLARIRAHHGQALLCDMHSMPPLSAAQAADIVVGDRYGRTAAPWLVDLVAGWLTHQGYRVTRNLPYAGGHGVELHGRPAEGIHAIQLEIDRRLYMEADGRSMSAGATIIQKLIARLSAMLASAMTSRPAHPIAAE